MRKKTPLNSIRNKCLDCCAGSKLEVRLCPTNNCELYPYRFGRNPNRQGVGKCKPNDLLEPHANRENVP